jgi:hypothetical protein
MALPPPSGIAARDSPCAEDGGAGSEEGVTLVDLKSRLPSYEFKKADITSFDDALTYSHI